MILSLKNMSRLTVTVFLASQMTACTDAQVGAVSGAIIGAVIADSLSGGGSSSSSSNNGGYDHGRRPDPGYGRPGYGNPGYGRPPGRGNGGGYYPRAMTRTLSVNSELVDGTDSSEKIAERFEISTESAMILMAESEKLKAGDLTVMTQLGLSEAELTLMSQGENPSADTLKKFMAILKTDATGAHNVIQALKEKAAELL